MRTEWFFNVFTKITSYPKKSYLLPSSSILVRTSHPVYLRGEFVSLLPSLALDNPAARGRSFFVPDIATSRAVRIAADKFLSSLQSLSSRQRRPMDDVILHMQE
jgi:hypothetical protein